MRRILAIAVFSAAAGFAYAAEAGLAWYDRAYPAEFRFIQEKGTYDKDSWEVLSQDERTQELAAAKEGAGQRLGEVRAYYSGMIQKWRLEEIDGNLAMLDDQRIAAVKLWLSAEHSAYLEAKRARLGAFRASYAAGSLSEKEIAAAAPYLSADAAAQLKTLHKSGAGGVQAAALQEKRQGEISKRVDGVKGAYGESEAGSGGGKKFFDNAGQYGESAESPALKLGGDSGTDTRKIDSGYYRGSHARTVAGGLVPELAGSMAVSHTQAPFNKADLARMDSVVADMKVKRQAAGSENGWLGNFKQSVGLSKAESGCSGWSDATIAAIKNDPVLSQKYEVGYVRGLRNPLGAVTKWPPSAPLPLPHFVAVVWPKGTDPNNTAIYVDSWAKETKRGPIREYTYEYSFDPKDMTPTVYYNREVKREITLPGGKKRIVTETVETPVPFIKANPWIFVK